MNVEATPALRTDEVNSARTMIKRVEERFDMKPTRLVGDNAHGTAENHGWMVNEKHIEPHVPVWDKTERTEDTFGRSAFTFDNENNRPVCPTGNC